MLLAHEERPAVQQLLLRPDRRERSQHRHRHVPLAQLGGDKQPVYDCRSIGESFYRLRKAQYITDGTDNFGLQFQDYCTDSFVSAACFEKASGSGASHTGVNTMGQNLVLNLYNCGPKAANVHIVCHYDCVLSITSGVRELEY